MGNKILLLSGYDAASHRHWRQLLVKGLPEFDWTQLVLPDRHFYWRARSNGMTFAYSHATELSEKFDLIVATSMVDLCSLRGFVPALASVPTIVYFHENQFDFPVRNSSTNIVNAQLTSIYTALCADCVLFNSSYNRESYFDGASRLLRKMPDGIERGIMLPVEKCAQVLPVPVNPTVVPASPRTSITGKKSVEIVWNHRWEYDKQPEVFFAAMRALKETGVKFKLHVMGQSFRQVPECFSEARHSLSEEIVTWGFQPEEAYHAVLDKAHIVMSTALHDFQGLSMLEAIQHGCVPVGPDRVAYPEYIPKSLLYCTDADEVKSAVARLLEVVSGELPSPPDISCYNATELLPRYRKIFGTIMGA
ncbi:hypothetical protein AB833_19105 [Chromatiales bacterium (ex Bugula neritina AB1)]|nr:hypothetical protein AB833_19105 [Chromatiales bacterium (ex Bugula neritina AB1)]